MKKDSIQYDLLRYYYETVYGTNQTKQEGEMRLPRSKLITKIIVFALIIYAGVSLINIRARIENAQAQLNDARRAVAELEVTNSELEYDIEHHNEPDVIADIARSNLGLVLPGEMVFYDGGNEPS